MSMPVTLQPSARTPLRRRLAARGAVGAALLLARLSPGRIRRALTLVAKGARPATAEEALAARRAVVSVSRRCAGQGCLPRAIATALLCRLSGRWPDWCTGVRTEPFRAHAWVEADGAPVGEGEDARYYRTVIAVRAPR
ncbi:lasso peptide biosynthesis B2 protein [Streptomyces albidoflavus]|uniref:lasso peptide biosynthesis B2 protein n=1 Tax=Streptomyces TaxID=1883 RepID=UPI00063EAAD5|nr:MULTISPECIES: lasso peptide biosynthesis B2 protein [unclassified Streptomyces]KLJ03154.1 hypothetical protein WQ59_09860 [Streptomyces sp. KE1]MCK2141938.1 lasso peptide biosynthesis B2 protein [Streptomyces sp. WAC00276]